MELIAVLLIIGVIITAESILYGGHWTKNLEYRCYFDAVEVHVGDEVELVEEVTNGKLLPLPWMKSELTASKWLDFAETQSSVTDKTRFVSSFFMLKSYHKVSRRWKVKCLKRGIYSIESAVLVASNLFGHINLSCPVPKDKTGGELRVLPAPCECGVPLGDNACCIGDIFVRRQLIPDPFFHNGAREYQPHDSTKKISWKITAKEQRLMVYQDDYTVNQTVAVLLNMQSREYELDSVYDENALEKCITVCAKLIYDAYDYNVPVRFLSNTSLTDNRKESIITELYAGLEHTYSLLRTLAQLQMMNTESFAPFLSGIVPRLNHADIFIVTAYVNEKILLIAEENPRVRIILAGGVPDKCLDLAEAAGRRIIKV